MLDTDKMQQTAGEFAGLNADPHSIRSLLGQEGQTAQTSLSEHLPTPPPTSPSSQL